MRPKNIKFIWWIWNAYVGSDSYSLEVSSHALLKVATKGSSRGEREYENEAFLGYFSETKTEEYD